MSWKKQLAKVVQVSSKIALHQIMMASTTEYYYEREFGRSQYGPLHIDDSRHVWQQLDPQERGHTKLESLLKWLEQYAHWQVPPEETGKIYRALAGRDPDRLISKALWFKNMSDHLLSEEE